MNRFVARKHPSPPKPGVAWTVWDRQTERWATPSMFWNKKVGAIAMALKFCGWFPKNK